MMHTTTQKTKNAPTYEAIIDQLKKLEGMQTNDKNQFQFLEKTLNFIHNEIEIKEVEFSYISNDNNKLLATLTLFGVINGKQTEVICKLFKK